MSNDQETEDDQNDDVENNDRVPQECAKCKHPIKYKAPKATCNNCGAHYHLVCTGFLRTQKEEIRDGHRECGCCSGRKVTEVNQVLSLPATNPPATLVETNTSAAESEKEPKAQLDGIWCTECKGKIHRGARQLKCIQCKSPFHIQCMTTMRSQANVYLQTPTWRCPRCRPQGDQKDTDDDTKPKLDKTSAGIFKLQISILQWNANGIYRESQLLEDLAEKHKVDVIAKQETRLLPSDEIPTLTNYFPVRRDRPVQGEAREGGLLTYVKKSLPYKVCRPLNNEEGALERLSIQIPIPNQQTVTISNWYLSPKNSHFLQRIGFSMSVFKPEIQENEIICADLNAHNEIWDKHAHFDDRGAQLEETIMDAEGGFLNDAIALEKSKRIAPENPRHQIAEQSSRQRTKKPSWRAKAGAVWESIFGNTSFFQTARTFPPMDADR